jgi:hypothetical protein
VELVAVVRDGLHEIRRFQPRQDPPCGLRGDGQQGSDGLRREVRPFDQPEQPERPPDLGIQPSIGEIESRPDGLVQILPQGELGQPVAVGQRVHDVGHALLRADGQIRGGDP